MPYAGLVRVKASGESKLPDAGADHVGAVRLAPVARSKGVHGVVSGQAGSGQEA